MVLRHRVQSIVVGCELALHILEPDIRLVSMLPGTASAAEAFDQRLNWYQHVDCDEDGVPDSYLAPVYEVIK